VLEAQRSLAMARCVAVGVTLESDAFVWSQAPDYRQPLRPSRVTTQFTELRSRLGLGAIRFHHLRHFAATVMLAGGIDVRTVAGRLGHSRPTLTLQTYAHVLDVTDRRAADVLAKSISPEATSD
jgi:integrase